jgi:tetratricopeptide (TPR) repeat protein
VFYLTIPLLLACIAFIGVWVIVWRKASFLRKLTPESHEVGHTWFHDMAPEAIEWFHGIPWKRYQQDVLVEFEKFLRRARLLFSTVDRMSEQLVRKVRRVNQETAKQVVAHQEQVQARKEAQEEEQDPDAIDMDDPEQLKQEEQRLIVAIAQDPKDAELYSDLAKVSMRMRNYADAVEAMEQAIKLEPGNEAYLKRLERARRKKEELAAAGKLVN